MIPNKPQLPSQQSPSVAEQLTSPEGLKSHRNWIKENPGKAAKLNLIPSGESTPDWRNPGGSAGPYVPPANRY